MLSAGVVADKDCQGKLPAIVAKNEPNIVDCGNFASGVGVSASGAVSEAGVGNFFHGKGHPRFGTIAK